MINQDEISPIPHLLGYSVEAPDETVNVLGMDADVNIGGLLFLSTASDDDPYQRQLQKVRKEQIDQSQNPGDSSLQDWWMRTQTDFSGGAGQDFMEPVSDAEVSRRYLSSAGVDPFTVPGQVSMLTTAEEVGTALGGSTRHIARWATGFATAGGTAIRTYTLASPPVAGTGATASAAIGGLAVAANFLMVSMVGKVATMPVAAPAAPVDRYINGGSSVPVVAYLKNRTMVMAKDKVWEVPGSPDQALNMATAPTVVDLADSSWSWVGAASTPSAILLAGNGASSGSILSLTIDPQSGALPTLSAPVAVAEFPPNERITAIATYLGTFIAIATTAGVRVGELNQNGGLTYGPLLGSPISLGDFTAWDRFVQYPVADAGDGRGGLVRIDLSEIASDGRAPWSTFSRIGTTDTVTDHAIIDGISTVMMDDNGQLWFTPLTGALDAGWLTTSNVRYGTLEFKNFQSVKINAASPVVGSLVVRTVNDGVTSDIVGTVTEGTGPFVSFRTGNRRSLSHMGLEFTFTPPDPNTGDGFILEAWSMRALPALDDRGQQILMPLLCFDFERSSRGVPTGFEGRALLRWNLLLDLIRRGVDIQITELNSGSTYVAIAEDCSFRQVSPPERASGFGGIISLLMRESR